MFFILSKIFDFAISPLNWIVVLILLSLLSKKKERKKKYLLSASFTLLFFTNPFILNLIMNAWEIPAQEISEIHDTYDAGIMLGGTIRYYNSDVKRPVFGNGVDRFMQVQELYHYNKIKNIILSSGSGSLVFDKIKEADLLKAQAERTGIDSTRLLAESNSRNTYENAQETAQLIKEKNLKPPFLLITSAFHMRRSLLCFKKAGVEVIPFSVDQHSGAVMFTPDKTFLPSLDALLDWNVLIHEWAGMTMYKLAGYI
jgi:uncharacterized SAM-binding protein YcdF (DUF218 family)